MARTFRNSPGGDRKWRRRRELSRKRWTARGFLRFAQR